MDAVAFFYFQNTVFQNLYPERNSGSRFKFWSSNQSYIDSKFKIQNFVHVISSVANAESRNL